MGLVFSRVRGVGFVLPFEGGSRIRWREAVGPGNEGMVASGGLAGNACREVSLGSQIRSVSVRMRAGLGSVARASSDLREKEG